MSSLFGACESMLTDKISDEDIFINGFAPVLLGMTRQLILETEFALLQGVKCEMTLVFTDVFLDIMPKHISFQIITCNDKDAPWITPQVKTAIQRNSSNS